MVWCCPNPTRTPPERSRQCTRPSMTPTLSLPDRSHRDRKGVRKAWVRRDEAGVGPDREIGVLRPRRTCLMSTD